MREQISQEYFLSRERPFSRFTSASFSSPFAPLFSGDGDRGERRLFLVWFLVRRQSSLPGVMKARLTGNPFLSPLPVLVPQQLTHFLCDFSSKRMMSFIFSHQTLKLK